MGPGHTHGRGHLHILCIPAEYSSASQCGHTVPSNQTEPSPVSRVPGQAFTAPGAEYPQYFILLFDLIIKLALIFFEK